MDGADDACAVLGPEAGGTVGGEGGDGGELQWGGLRKKRGEGSARKEGTKDRTSASKRSRSEDERRREGKSGTYLSQSRPDALFHLLPCIEAEHLAAINDERDDGGDDESGDEERGDGVPARPAGKVDEDGGDDDADGAEDVGEDVLRRERGGGDRRVSKRSGTRGREREGTNEEDSVHVVPSMIVTRMVVTGVFVVLRNRKREARGSTSIASDEIPAFELTS